MIWSCDRHIYPCDGNLGGGRLESDHVCFGSESRLIIWVSTNHSYVNFVVSELNDVINEDFRLECFLFARMEADFQLPILSELSCSSTWIM